MAFPPLPTVLHPILVHLTIGLVPTAAVLATWFAWRKTPWTRPATYAILTASAVLALMTMGAGFRDYFRVKPGLDGEPLALLETHELLGVVTTITVVITALIAWWRRADVLAKPSWRWALAIALLAASLLIAITGWYGGALVYDFGISVNEITPNA